MKGVRMAWWRQIVPVRCRATRRSKLTFSTSGAFCRAQERPCRPQVLVRGWPSRLCGQAVDVAGRYVDPHCQAIILCEGDEPSIQTLERAQGDLKLSNGRAQTGQSRYCKRYGATTLFAAPRLPTIIGQLDHSSKRTSRLGHVLNSLGA